MFQRILSEFLCGRKISKNKDEYNVLKHEYDEQVGRNLGNIKNFCVVFNKLHNIDIPLDKGIIEGLNRLAGTTLLEAGYILKALRETRNVPGDWCEYGVAHGRTSALLAAALKYEGSARKLWLYDSFEGLPAPHEKDVLIDDIYKKGKIEEYAGYLSFPEQYAIDEVRKKGLLDEQFNIVKGWITAESLHKNSPSQISFAYLDMDFYQSTYDVLKNLFARMPVGGVAVVDDYGFFSEGVRTAVSEIQAEYPGVFEFENPFGDKFAILKRVSG